MSNERATGVTILTVLDPRLYVSFSHPPRTRPELDNMPTPLDTIDRNLIRQLRQQARASLTDIASAAGVARGTAYSRLDRLVNAGVITGHGPDLDAKAAGFDVTAFCTLEISQGTHDDTVRRLAAIPEVLEVHTVTGVGDLLCRVVARSNDDLHRVLLAMTEVETVQRSQTQLALRTDHRRHLADLLAED